MKNRMVHVWPWPVTRLHTTITNRFLAVTKQALSYQDHSSLQEQVLMYTTCVTVPVTLTLNSTMPPLISTVASKQRRCVQQHYRHKSGKQANVITQRAFGLCIMHANQQLVTSKVHPSADTLMRISMQQVRRRSVSPIQGQGPSHTWVGHTLACMTCVE